MASSIVQRLPNAYEEKCWCFTSTCTVVWVTDDDKISSDGSDSNSEARQ